MNNLLIIVCCLYVSAMCYCIDSFWHFCHLWWNFIPFYAIISLCFCQKVEQYLHLVDANSMTICLENSGYERTKFYLWHVVMNTLLLFLVIFVNILFEGWSYMDFLRLSTTRCENLNHDYYPTKAFIHFSNTNNRWHWMFRTTGLCIWITYVALWVFKKRQL
jgi:hypothetical protein